MLVFLASLYMIHVILSINQSSTRTIEHSHCIDDRVLKEEKTVRSKWTVPKCDIETENIAALNWVLTQTTLQRLELDSPNTIKLKKNTTNEQSIYNKYHDGLKKKQNR